MIPYTCHFFFFYAYRCISHLIYLYAYTKNVNFAYTKKLLTIITVIV